MKIELRVDAFAAAIDSAKGRIAEAATGAMRDTMPSAKQELRDQIVAAGLGTRLANTWRGEVYPKSARSLRPAGAIYSKAPMIIDSFVRGATIVPINGSKYLAIPTANVPFSRGSRGSRRRMSPLEVEAVFNQDLILRRGRSGRMLAFIDAIAAKNGKGFRPKTKGRLRQGRSSQLVLMFTLVPSVRMPKLLDLAGPGQRWASAFGSALQRKLAVP